MPKESTKAGRNLTSDTGYGEELNTSGGEIQKDAGTKAIWQRNANQSEVCANQAHLPWAAGRGVFRGRWDGVEETVSVGRGTWRRINWDLLRTPGGKVAASQNAQVDRTTGKI